MFNANAKSYVVFALNHFDFLFVYCRITNVVVSINRFILKIDLLIVYLFFIILGKFMFLNLNLVFRRRKH